MHSVAPPKRPLFRRSELAVRAIGIRCRPTASESLLWQALRRHQLGCEIRRQVPLGRFVADFLVPQAHVVIEVDGPYHSRRRSADARRDAWLGRAGYRVLRLEAEQVEHQLPAAIERIRAELEAARCSAR